MSTPRLVARFACRHIRSVANTDHRGACRKCSRRGLSLSPARRPTKLTARQAEQARTWVAQGKSQRWVAEALGVSQPSIGRLIHGETHAHDTVRLVAFRPLPLPPRADEMPSVHADRSYSLFPPRRTA
jgi:hypothetical protein